MDSCFRDLRPSILFSFKRNTEIITTCILGQGASNKDTNQSAQMRRLVCAFVARMQKHQVVHVILSAGVNQYFVLPELLGFLICNSRG